MPTTTTTDDRNRATALVAGLRDRTESGAESLFPIVYEELRKIARRQLRRERSGHTLSTTDLVHEAYLRLVDDTQLTWADRAHFCAIACRCMRQILVDYSRRRNRSKRGGDLDRLTLKTDLLLSLPSYDVILTVDDALRQLAARDERLVQVVECRFFGGMSVEDTAVALDMSPRTVARDWIRAKGYLAYLLKQPLASSA